MLELEDRLRVEEVRWTLATPLVFAPRVEAFVSGGCTIFGIRSNVPFSILSSDSVETDAAKDTLRAGEVLVNKRL